MPRRANAARGAEGQRDVHRYFRDRTLACAHAMADDSASEALVIERLTFGFDALARLRGQVIFVPYGAPGDRVRVVLREHRRSWARGEIVEVWCRSWRLYSTEDGLPYDDITSIAPGPQGDVWIGTRIGAIRFDGVDWEYRQGRRWLPGDDVRDVAVAEDGAAWFATDGGVGRIGQQPMTLAEKAARFEAEIDRYHRRTPFEYVDSVRLARPGDTSELRQRDSDNDGLWTGMYGAGEAFAYAATGSPVARRRARQAFEALRFLSEVTQDAEPPGRPGLIARTILSTSGPDPNLGLLERDRRRRRQQDRLWKLLSPRWPKSADGRWYWKSDASSDELDGHFFFYAQYYDLVADSEAEYRSEVRPSPWTEARLARSMRCVRTRSFARRMVAATGSTWDRTPRSTFWPSTSRTPEPSGRARLSAELRGP